VKFAEHKTMRTRRKFTSKFKTKVVLEALSERYTLAQLAERHKLHPNQISNWKKQFVSNTESVFDNGAKTPQQESDEQMGRLLKTIGQQKVEIDFLKSALR